MTKQDAEIRAGISRWKDQTGSTDTKGLVILLVSVVLAAACAGGVYVYLKHVPQAQAAEEKVPVVVASRDVTFGTKLGPEHLRVVQYPTDALPKGYYSSPDSVLSRSTRVFVMQGEAILASKLSSVGGGLSLRIPDNMRAISLSVNEITGVNGFVLPGDRVDVLVTVDYVDGTNNSVTKIILQNVEVLASGSKTETKQNQQITTQTMTLLVDPKGAEMVALGQHQGHVHVVLRNPEDAKIVDAKPTDTRDVLSLRGAAEGAPKRVAAPKPTPPPAPEPPPSFTIIRNGTITTQSQPETKK